MKLILVLSLCAVCYTTSADWRMIGRPRYGLPELPPTAQKPAEKPPYRAVESDFRFVDGKIYNVILSPLWAAYIAGSEMTVIKVLPEGVVFRLYETLTDTSTTRGSFGSSRAGYGRSSSVTKHTSLIPAGSCFVKNFPQPQPLTEGEWKSTPLRVMCVAPFQYEGQTLPAYDCGFPNTAENRKRFNRAAPTILTDKTTNAVSK